MTQIKKLVSQLAKDAGLTTEQQLRILVAARNLTKEAR